MKKKEISTLAFIFLLVPGFYSKTAAQSHEFESGSFVFPMACQLGENCWPVNYVDVDPAEKAAVDFRCGSRTYDQHKGSDFALGSVAQMASGVDVLAAADGKILRVRDGENDAWKSPEDLKMIAEAGKECGNGVLVDHGGGITAIYCHLKQGSIVVKPDQVIKAGEKIAQVGQSGMAEFPHLHFGVFRGDDVFDPFTGSTNEKGCNAQGQQMWKQDLAHSYGSSAIFDGGFQTQPPDFEALQKGENQLYSVSIKAASFVFWAGFYTVNAGDEIVLKILDPQGGLFTERNITQDKTRARQYYFVGRKIGNVQLMKGTYQGVAEINAKDNASPQSKTFQIMVE